MTLPPDHPRRAELNDEVHARPPEALTAPAAISFVALLVDPADRGREAGLLAEVAALAGRAAPAPEANHFSVDLGGFRLRWERHTEFSRYMFVAEGSGDPTFSETALDRVPAAIVARLPGEVIAACHAVVLEAGAAPADLDGVSRGSFEGHAVVGSEVAGTGSLALTDFRIHADGFSRIAILDRGLSPRQAGRVAQRLLEIDTYKQMALLTLPVARHLAPALSRAERDLAAITTRLAADSAGDEGELLDRLTQLEAEIESFRAANHFRFTAARAYYDLVQRRIAELRENRIKGLQTFGEFIERRLAPAMSTCAATSARQEALSQRVGRATRLLSTRVDVTRTRQNGELLRSMNRRAELQLRLQETVEGLSIAALTYYIVGLVSYAAKGAAPLGLPVSPETAMAASIPVVLLLVMLRIRRIRRAISAE